MRPSTAWGPGGGARAPGRLVLALMDGWDQNGRGMAGGVQSTRAGAGCSGASQEGQGVRNVGDPGGPSTGDWPLD